MWWLESNEQPFVSLCSASNHWTLAWKWQLDFLCSVMRTLALDQKCFFRRKKVRQLNSEQTGRNLCTRIFRNFSRIFDKSKLLGVHSHPQLCTTEWTARHKPWKQFTKQQNIQFFQLSVPAISVASPLHWIIYVVNNNLKKSSLLHLREIHNSNLAYLGFQRLENLS